MPGCSPKGRIFALMKRWVPMPIPWMASTASRGSPCGRPTPSASRWSAQFNYWDGRRHPMRLRRETGIWELFIPGAHPGQLYKFEMID